MAGAKWSLPFSGGACIGMHWTFCSVSAKAAFNLNSMSSPSHWFSKPCPHPPNQPTPWWPWHRDVASQANIFPALGMICLRWNYINLEDENKKFWKRNMHFRQSSKRRSSASLFQWSICSAEVRWNASQLTRHATCPDQRGGNCSQPIWSIGICINKWQNWFWTTWTDFCLPAKCNFSIGGNLAAWNLCLHRI